MDNLVLICVLCTPFASILLVFTEHWTRQVHASLRLCDISHIVLECEFNFDLSQHVACPAFLRASHANKAAASKWVICAIQVILNHFLILPQHDIWYVCNCNTVFDIIHTSFARCAIKFMQFSAFNRDKCKLYTNFKFVCFRFLFIHRLFGNTGMCAACNKVIPAFEMVMRARNNVYHLECFACQQCNHR